MKKLGLIEEASYLSAMNATQYRHIMRVFYNEYEKMNFRLSTDEILIKLHMYEEFGNYSLEQLKMDLNALVKWKNLAPIQDPKRVYTISDYKNKQFRYTMSDKAVEIERMAIKLENLFMESGNLSTNYIYRIYDALNSIHEISMKPSKNINEWWHSLQEDFKRLNQSYQDYLREFYSVKADKLLKSVDFILHKDRFISYLNEFIQDLQIGATKIESIIKSIEQTLVEKILEQVIQSELAMPHPISNLEEEREFYIRENVYGKWDALKSWFVSTDNRPSESNQIMDITDEIIRKIIQNAALIVQLQNWGISRKKDYKKFINLFLNCEELEEAHRLSAHIFGIQEIRHFVTNEERLTESINCSTYDEEPMTFFIKPHNRGYKPQIDKSGFVNKSLQKLEQRALYLKKIENDKETLYRYIKDNKLDVSCIEECISEGTRMTLLNWISSANLTESKKGRTEFGKEFRLIKTNEMCTLRCEDGELTMSRYILEFKEE